MAASPSQFDLCVGLPVVFAAQRNKRGSGAGLCPARRARVPRTAPDRVLRPTLRGKPPRLTDAYGGQDKALALLRDASSRFALFYAGKWPVNISADGKASALRCIWPSWGPMRAAAIHLNACCGRSGFSRVSKVKITTWVDERTASTIKGLTAQDGGVGKQDVRAAAQARVEGTQPAGSARRSSCQR